MGVGPITPTPQGPATRPDPSIDVSQHTQGFGKLFRDTGPVWTEELSDFDGVIVADGMSPIRHFYGGDFVRTGLLGVIERPTVAYSGAVATCILTFSGNPVNGNWIDIGFGGGVRVYFVTALDLSDGAPNQVLIGAAFNNTTDNLQALVNDEAGSGSTYVNADRLRGVSPYDFASVYGFYLSNNASPFMTFSASFGGSAGNTLTLSVDPSSQISINTPWSGGADGSGACPESGSYYWAYGHYRALDGAIGAIGQHAELFIGGPGSVDISDLVHSDDESADYVWVWRTQSNQGLFYKDAEAKRPDTTAIDNVCDEDLKEGVVYDESLFRPYGSGHVPRYRYVVQHQGMLFGGGAIMQADYSVGSYQVPSGGLTAVLTGGAIVTEDLEGKTFIPSPDTNTVEFLIVGVDVAANTILLNKGIATQVLDAPYVIRDKRSPTAIGYTPPNRINQWPPWQQITGVNAAGEEGITGMFSAWESLFIWTQDSLWRLSGTEPSNFILRKIFSNHGCVSGHSIVFADGALHWFGPEGVWRWAGSGEPILMTKPRVQSANAIGIDKTIRRTNWDVAEQIYATYDGNDKLIAWHVPLDDEFIPTRAITMDLQTGAWAVERYDDWTFRADIRGIDGRVVNLGGDYQGIVWEADLGNSDGAFGFEPLQKVAAGASAFSVPLTGSPVLILPQGVPALFISPCGDFMRGKIESYTGGVLQMSEPLPSVPDEESYIVIGAIDLHLESGDFTNGVIDNTKVMADATIGHIPSANGEYFYAAGRNDDEPKIPTYGAQVGDLSNDAGKTHFRPNRRGYRHRHWLRSFAPNTDPEFVQLDYSMRMASAPRVRQ